MTLHKTLSCQNAFLVKRLQFTIRVADRRQFVDDRAKLPTGDDEVQVVIIIRDSHIAEPPAA